MTRCYCFELTVSRVSPRSNNIPYAVFQYAIGSDNLKRTGTICSISFVQPLNIEKFYELETLGIQAPDCSCPKIWVGWTFREPGRVRSTDGEKLRLLQVAFCPYNVCCTTLYTCVLPRIQDSSLHCLINHIVTFSSFFVLFFFFSSALNGPFQPLLRFAYIWGRG